MQPIKTEYRGFDLIYLTHEDEWSIGGDLSKDRRTFDKLSDAKIYIDEILKEKFKRFEVFLRDTFGDGFKLVTVTSRIDDKYYWTMNKDQLREKASLNYIYACNDKNKKILDVIKDISTRIEELKDQKESLIRNMDKFKEV